MAQSDNGVDHTEEGYREIALSPEHMVIDRDEVVGCFCEGHLFLFDDADTHEFTTKEESFVGGWGDITETHYYTLKNKSSQQS